MFENYWQDTISMTNMELYNERALPGIISFQGITF